ncbi:MAG: NADH-quinone oxidoreductase subunit J [Caldilineales bacterium]|nr:NADH-quinone oxidoreductase subunit J [Caldilineales bacterium]
MPLLFAALALIALVGAAGVLLSRNPVYSALSLLLNFVAFAVMYVMLSAQFLGVVQIIVYAGAIVVLFLFVVMLIGGNLPALGRGRRAYVRAAGVILAALFLLALLFGLARPLPNGLAAVGAPDGGSVQALGLALYVDHIVPFELASILLLTAMLGGIVLARRYQAPPKD